jgi:hypothetical protein
MQRRAGIAPPAESNRTRRLRQAGFTTAAALGAAAVIIAVIQLIGEAYLPASAFGMWALCCATFALRFREPTS